MQQPTDEELAIMGHEAPAYLTDTQTVKGKSGTEYREVNYFSEMSGDHEQAMMALVAPIIPDLVALVQFSQQAKQKADEAARASGKAAVVNGADMFASIDLEKLLDLLIVKGIDRRFAAVICLPVNDREFRPEDVEARVEDLMVLTKAQAWGTVLRFFNGARSGFADTFRGFSQVSSQSQSAGG